MVKLLHSKTLSVAIERSPQEVYDYIVNPDNFSEWATSFCLSVQKSGDNWIVETTDGPMTIRFVERNDYGVWDHYVHLPSGQEVLNPVRVIPNGSGCEMIFTVFQLPDVPDEQFANDWANVEKDLKTLKRVMES